MDFVQLVSFSFGWIGKKRSLKYAALTWLVEIVFLALLAALAFLLFRETIVGLLVGSISTMSGLLLEPAAVEAMVATFLLSSLPIFLLFAAALLGIHGLAMVFALKKAGLEPVPFSFKRFLRLIALFIACPILALVSFFNRRLLVILLAAFVFAVMTFIPDELASISAGLASIALLALYSVVVFHNLVRQSQAPVIFLARKVPILTAFRASWFFTKGKFWSIIAAWFVVKLFAFALFSLFFFVLSLLLTAVLFSLLALFFLAFQIALLLTALILLPFVLVTFSHTPVSIYSNLMDDSEDKRLIEEARFREEKAERRRAEKKK